MNYTFSSDWVSQHADNWRSWFAHLIGKPNVRLLEIGCWEGRSACWWIENLLTDSTSRLTCVDPFAWVDNSARFNANIVASGQSHRVEVIREFSAKALPRLIEQGRQFDLIYIDGSHFAKDVLLDGLLSLSLLKPDGLLLFDDYPYRNENGSPGPGVAIDALVACCGLHVIYHGWQVVLRAG